MKFAHLVKKLGYFGYFYLLVLDLSDVKIVSNMDAIKSNSVIYAHLFYKSKDSDSTMPVFIKSVASNWSTLKTRILESLESNGLPTFGMSLASPDAAEDSDLNFIDSKSFFTKANMKKLAKRVMFIAIKSREERNKPILFYCTHQLFSLFLVSFLYMERLLSADNVPLDYQVLFNRIYKIYHDTGTSDSVKTLCRRSMVIFLNKGIPMPFLDKLIQVEGTVSDQLKPLCNFERVGISFNNGIESLCQGNISIELDEALFDMKEQLFINSNESTWRSLFWDRVIPKLFRSSTGLLDDVPVKYFLNSEWSTLSLFPEDPERKVDYVVHLELASMKLPVMLIEYGAEAFSPDSSHKDLMKMNMMLIVFCHLLALELEKQGKKAELARVYGLWIGGSHAQMIVAHPIIKEIPNSDPENGNFEIHIVISTVDHWHTDILHLDSLASCTDLCCGINFDDLDEIEGLIKARKPAVQPSTAPFSFIESEYQILDDPVPAITENNIVPETEKAYKGEINEHGLKRLKLYVILVKRRIALLNSDRSNSLPTARRNFKKLPNAPVPMSRRSTGSKTRSLNKMIKSKSKSILITKGSRTELMLLRRLAMYPVFFPKLYDVKVLKNGLIKYRFEKMIPIQNLATSERKPMDAALVDALTFAIHCLHGLYILHDIVNLVHGDISPNNILFSSLDNIWKLIDFDRSMPVHESERIKRISGTEGYISPSPFKRACLQGNPISILLEESYLINSPCHS